MKDLVKVFKALADSNRIRIIKMLEVRPLCVCEFTEILQLAPSTVSKHLSVLREAGFIDDTKDGRWVNYRLAEKGNTYITRMLPLLNEWLPSNETVIADRTKVLRIDRSSICST